MRCLSFFSCLVFVSSLYACGGGGGGGGGRDIQSSLAASSAGEVMASSSVSFSSRSDNSSSAVSLSMSQLVFEVQGRLELFEGDVFSNKASVNGNILDINYESSDLNVAKVDEAGTVVAVAPGQSVITAKYNHNGLSVISASYEIVVVSKKIDVKVFIGNEYSQVYFSDGAKGLSFHRNPNYDCEGDNIVTCSDTVTNIIGDDPIFDPILSSNGLWTLYALTHGGKQVNFYPDREGFINLIDHQVLVFKDKLWVFGGDNGYDPTKVIMSSADGISWVRHFYNGGGFSARERHQVVFFQGKLWAIGGYGHPQGVEGFINYQFLNDVWSSEDGINWELELSKAAFPERASHKIVNFNRKLWLIGGEGSGGENFNDVWSSSNGIDWVKEADNVIPGNMSKHEVVVFNNKIWLSKTSELWSSDDGRSWGKELLGHKAVGKHQFIIHSDKLWLVNAEFKNDIWSSVDGVNWSSVSETTNLPIRGSHKSISFKNKLWIIGGNDGDTSNAVISSTEGVVWNEMLEPKFTPRVDHQLVSFNGNLFLVGGKTDGGYKNDIWTTRDGFTWKKLKDHAGFSARYGHKIIEFKEKLFLIGGQDVNGSKNDIWSSIDGAEWVLETASAEFDPAPTNEVAELNGELILVGDNNRVWSSSNGINWSLKTSLPPFSKRTGFKIVSFNNQVLLIGGMESVGRDLKNDIWITADGVEWQNLASSAAFSPRAWHELNVFNGKLVLAAGTDPYVTDDIWVSSNGIDWDFVSQAYFLAWGHQLKEHNNQLWLIGGYGINNLSDIRVTNDAHEWMRLYQRTIDFSLVPDNY